MKLMLRRLDHFAMPGESGTPLDANGHEDPTRRTTSLRGPARVTGWRRRLGSEGRRFPLMHAKVAVILRGRP